MPSAIAAVLTVLFLFVKEKRRHRYLSYALIVSAGLGIVGLAFDDSVNLLLLDVHAVHAWLGLIALGLAVAVAIDGIVFKQGKSRRHCRLGN